MAEPTPIHKPTGQRARVAAFMSGSGTNVRRLLELERKLAASAAGSPFEVVVLVTDTADRTECRAHEIARDFGELRVVELDIRQFYRERGRRRVTLKTDVDFEVRDEWTARLAELVAPYQPEIGALGGFEPLTNITGHFPCVNVHPGDLSVLVDGGRYLVGLHTVPVRRAILSGRTELRSSTILATPYTRKLEMDEGPVLMISEPLPIELPADMDLERLRQDEALLEEIAKGHQGRLKEVGDWEIFSLTVELVAEGRFALGEAGTVFFDGEPTSCGVRLPCPGLV